MASKLVMDAVAALLATYWTACPIIGVNAIGDTPADGSEFLTVQYPVSNETPITLGQVGQRLFREAGAIRFVLSVPRGLGIDLGAQHVDTLRALFRAAQFGGVNCLSASPSAIDDGNDDGAYYRMRVIVEYYADILA
jgi:hypothetical protein